MSVLDKLKNALFEVEYVEVEEPPKKEKKEKKVKEKKEKKEEKPIAKKIVLPGKKEEKVEQINEEDLKNDNFESRPKNEVVKNMEPEETADSFNFIDDSDFLADEYKYDNPKILQVLDEEVTVEKHQTRVQRNATNNIDEVRQESKMTGDSYKKEKEEKIETVNVKETEYKNSDYYRPKENKLYGVDDSYSLPVHEYGIYEKKEEKPYFKPSPIISPIYGILDKNYKSEDVVQKKEVRITSNYTRRNLSVDDIRNKAYGEKSKLEVENDIDSSFEVEEDEDDLLVDLSDKVKPEVKELTMGDALEYFQDLGLEYNVDYVDVSKERTTPKRVRDNYDDFELDDEKENSKVEEVKSVKDSKRSVTKNVVEVKDESNSKSVNALDDDNDNLFDLIDSMYQDKD